MIEDNYENAHQTTTIYLQKLWKNFDFYLEEEVVGFEVLKLTQNMIGLLDY